MADKLFNNPMPPPPQQDDKWTNTNSLGEKVERVFVRFTQRIILWGWGWFAELAVQIFDANMKILKPGMLRMFGPYLDKVANTPGVPSDIKEMIHRVKAETGEAGAIGVGAMLIGLLFTLLSAALKPVGELTTQGVNKLLPSTLPDPLLAASAHLRGIITYEDYLGIMDNLGWGDRDKQVVLAMGRYIPSIYEALEFYRRGLFGEQELDLALKQRMVSDGDMSMYKDLAYQTPPATDLIRFMVRDTFRDDIVAKFGYNEDYPDAIDQFLKKVGVSPEWGRHYWRSHWTLPSPTQAYEMLHRGLIDTGTLADLLKTADYPVFWRDKLMAISYNTYTRVDVRRLLQADILSEEEALQAYLDMGYAPDKARKMTDFALAGITQDEKDLTKTDILNLYEEGLTDRGATQSNLVKMGYDQKEAEDILKLADVNIAKAQRADAINYVKERFQARVIDEAGARNELATAGLKQQSVDRYVMAWRRLTETDEAVPSMADIKRWYIAKYINEDKYRAYLKLHKHSAENIELYVREIKDLTTEA